MTIDFLKGKTKAIARAEFYLTLNNPPDIPNAYVIGRMMFFATLRFYETATKAERAKNELYGGWLDYFILKTLVDKIRKSDSFGLYHQFNDWLDFAQKTYIQRTDDFLPAGWPRDKNWSCYGGLGSCQNLLAACLSFSWTFFWFIKDHFESIENPGSQKTTDTILWELNNAFDNLAKTLGDVYDANIPSDLTKTCEDLLGRELGLYQRQLTIKQPASGGKAGGTKGTAETKQKTEGRMHMITVRSSKENWEDIKSAYDISKKDFGRKIKFVSDSFKRKIIFRDVEHAFILASQGFSKPALILAGGVIEELLRLYLEHKNIKPKNKRFVDYIKACEDNDLLKRGVSRLTDSIRDFRNLVHLVNEKTKRHTMSKATAMGAVSSIFTIANDFQ
jgi:hypothetical protein